MREIASSILPGSGLLVDFLDEFKRRKISKAQEILLNELKDGIRPLNEIETDEFIPIAYAFYKAAEEGTKNRNLKLLAKLIRKQITESCLNSDEYQTLQNNIKTLTQNELIVISVFVRRLKEYNKIRSIKSTDNNSILMLRGSIKSECAKIMCVEDNDDEVVVAYQRLVSKGWLLNAGNLMIDDPILLLDPSKELQRFGSELENKKN